MIIKSPGSILSDPSTRNARSSAPHVLSQGVTVGVVDMLVVGVEERVVDGDVDGLVLTLVDGLVD